MEQRVINIDAEIIRKLHEQEPLAQQIHTESA